MFGLKPRTPKPRFDPSLLKDLLDVGSTKLLGYLPLETISGCGTTADAITAEVEAKGMTTFLFAKGKCNTASGALYVADLKRLQSFLHLPRQSVILQKTKWPTDAAEFIRKVATAIAEDKDLYAVIALAFNDRRPEFQQRNAIAEVEATSTGDQPAAPAV